MSELRPLSSLVAALALCACILGTLSPDRSAARPDGLTPVATITGALDDATDAEPMQASCGDGRCSPPEDCRSCPSDCGSCCGDGRCAAPEDCNSCPRDCGSCCGDGRCSPPEDARSCPRDCS